MNCREAERQIFAERDGALDSSQRAALAMHIAECSTCRQAQRTLATTINSWRMNTASIATPDPDREWADIRRLMRGGVVAGTTRVEKPLHRRYLAWLAFAPVAAAAAFGIMLWTNQPGPAEHPRATPAPAVARNGSVEVSAGDGSVVFVDDKSGWVVVWDGDTKRG